VAVSSYTAEELEQASHGHDVRRGVWIRPMGVEVDLFHPSRAGAGKRSDLCTRMGAPERSRLLLYAGRLAPEKNLPLLIQTARLLGPEYHWLIAGSGPARDSLCEQLGQCASFTYLGHISDREALADLFANVDAFVHPNPREPFGIAPLEVMASGTPLVGSNEGGVATYANESNAWLAAPAPQAFAAAVRQIFSDDKDRAKRLCHARQTAERYSWSAACLRFHELYRELVARTRDGAEHFDCEPAFYSTSPVR
jgi:alpha-1,6-mannosyltransferase